MPKFSSRNSQREQSLLRMHNNREEYSESYRSASQAAIDIHFSEHIKCPKKE